MQVVIDWKEKESFFQSFFLFISILSLSSTAQKKCVVSSERWSVWVFVFRPVSTVVGIFASPSLRLTYLHFTYVREQSCCTFGSTSSWSYFCPKAFKLRKSTTLRITVIISILTHRDSHTIWSLHADGLIRWIQSSDRIFYFFISISDKKCPRWLNENGAVETFTASCRFLKYFRV